MPRADRASQFMPFAALKGFEEALAAKENEVKEVLPMNKVINDVDVICEHKSDGTIIPLRIRFMNEDGEYEVLTIKGYRKSQQRGSRVSEDGIYVSDSTLIFDCMIHVLNIKRVVRLYYDPRTGSKWRMAV